MPDRVERLYQRVTQRDVRPLSAAVTRPTIDGMDDAVLDEMGRDECITLLCRCTVGRVAVDVEGAAPLVVPVNYVVDAGDIVFRSDLGTKLEALERAPMSFEIDDIDHGRHSGWSVLVRGTARRTEEWENRNVELEPWVGTKQHWVRLHMDDVSGRRIVLASLPPDTRGYR